MSQKVAAGLPEGMDLASQYAIQWSARDPATGDPVSGVVVSNCTMLVTLVGSSTVEGVSVSPLWIPLPLE